MNPLQSSIRPDSAALSQRLGACSRALDTSSLIVKFLLAAAMAFFVLAPSSVFAANQTWSKTGAVNGNWRAIIFPRVISSSTCADVGSLIVPAGGAWLKFKLLKGRKMLRDD